MLDRTSGRVVLVVIPAGTRNHFARDLGLSIWDGSARECSSTTSRSAPVRLP
jgi:diacylglycerol kinase family enzyme